MDLVGPQNGQNQANRDKILEAICRIDPEAKVSRVKASALNDALVSGIVAFEGVPIAEQDACVARILNERRQLSTWYTRDELVDVTKQLSSDRSGARQALVSTLLDRALTLTTLLSFHLGSLIILVL